MKTSVGIQPVIPAAMKDTATQVLPSTKTGLPKWLFALIAVLAVAIIVVLASGVLAPGEEVEPTPTGIFVMAPGVTATGTSVPIETVMATPVVTNSPEPGASPSDAPPPAASPLLATDIPIAA